jgi:hypothetical protein
MQAARDLHHPGRQLPADPRLEEQRRHHRVLYQEQIVRHARRVLSGDKQSEASSEEKIFSL